MERRNFLGMGAVMAGAAILPATSYAATAEKKPEGAVTLYYEFRVPMPEKKRVHGNIDGLSSYLKGKQGFLSFSFKQMTGESTMVRNYPAHLKGVLDRGYADGNGHPTSPKLPLFYTLFIRFDSYDALIASQVQAWFAEQIVPSLFAYKPTTPPTKTPIKLDYYEGIYTTIAAGDRQKIYSTPDEIRTFLQHQSDEVKNRYVTVENHVMIKDANREAFNQKVARLLSTAQQTFRPDIHDAGYDDRYPHGQAGTAQNSHYRKAVTTEILQNAFADGDARSYIMHGVWENMYDHENSHLDPRFLAAAGPVGAYVVSGPVEPFYDTIKQSH
ncbi:hypothetical protein WCX18_00410 [Sulfurimonas sp. HSL1-2]|uniref:hypothetical protein n=1 Tax=Thiomicrolovo zhangzhouensis TaxID=3131933 RepID=UPI0031F9C8C2